MVPEKIQTVLIIDTETTGLDPAKDVIVEVGAALYSLEHRTTIAQMSTLVDFGKGNAAEEVNRIPPKALLHLSTEKEMPTMLRHMATHADVFAAHRADFDRSFVAAADSHLAESLPWVDTKYDVEWPRSKHGDGLVHVALAHGVPVVSAHRALTDCMLLAALFERVQRAGKDLETMLKRALRPKVRLVADVPRERNDELKASGFRWDPDRRQWWRTTFVDDASSFAFPVRECA